MDRNVNASAVRKLKKSLTPAGLQALGKTAAVKPPMHPAWLKIKSIL
jgi:hypothetical protein